jgi:replicative DNA helicase
MASAAKESRDLPHSIEAEQGVLGSIAAQPSSIAACQRLRVTADYFHVPAHQTIYELLLEQWDSGGAIDLIIFTQLLRDKRKLSAIGGAAFLAHIFTFVPSAANIESYLEILWQKYSLRQVITMSNESVLRAYNEQDDIKGLLLHEEEKITTMLRHLSRRREIKEIVNNVIASLDTPEKVLGISTGFSSLDESVGGLPEGAKIVVAGEISGGKSALLQIMAKSLAVDRKIPTAIFTFEMSAEQTVQRIIQIHAGVSTWKIAKGHAELFEIQKYTAAAAEVAAAPLWVISERLSIKGIRSVILQFKPRVAMIDYLQIVPDPKQKGENRTDQLDRMSAETKQIAHQLGLTVIEASQLTETAEGMRTRGSRGITADSDQLWIIETEEGKGEGGKVPKRIVNAKQRDGEKGQVVPFWFHKATTTFIERN